VRLTYGYCCAALLAVAVLLTVLAAITMNLIFVWLMIIMMLGFIAAVIAVASTRGRGG
jgi:hypothetical protein